MQNSKFEIDAMFKEDAFSSLDKTVQAKLTAIKNNLLEQMGKDGFDYFANAKPQSAPEPRVEKFHRSGIEDFEINQETKTPF